VALDQLGYVDSELVQQTRDEDLSEELNGKIARPYLFTLFDKELKFFLLEGSSCMITSRAFEIDPASSDPALYRDWPPGKKSLD
jgi:hypothetical protein